LALDQIAKDLGVGERSDWYHINTRDVIAKGGGGLLHRFDNSLAAALESVYPDFRWQLWRFPQVPDGFWDRAENLREYANWLRGELEVGELKDWFRVSLAQIGEVGPLTPFHRRGGLIPFLREAYPDHGWEAHRPLFCKASQRRLKLTLERLLPGQVIYEDHLHPDLLFQSGQRIQLDLFSPGLALAFEYQGAQHYFDVPCFSPQRHYAERDQEKREACQRQGICLIEVPFWWDGDPSALAETIRKHKPGLVLSEREVGASVNALHQPKVL
jgi:hypothetical protein